MSWMHRSLFELNFKLSKKASVSLSILEINIIFFNSLIETAAYSFSKSFQDGSVLI